MLPDDANSKLFWCEGKWNY